MTMYRLAKRAWAGGKAVASNGKKYKLSTWLNAISDILIEAQAPPTPIQCARTSFLRSFSNIYIVRPKTSIFKGVWIEIPLPCFRSMVFDLMKFLRQIMHANLEYWPANLTGTRKCGLGAWKDLSLFILPCILGLKQITWKKIQVPDGIWTQDPPLTIWPDQGKYKTWWQIGKIFNLGKRKAHGAETVSTEQFYKYFKQQKRLLPIIY